MSLPLRQLPPPPRSVLDTLFTGAALNPRREEPLDLNPYEILVCEIVEADAPADPPP